MPTGAREIGIKTQIWSGRVGVRSESGNSPPADNVALYAGPVQAEGLQAWLLSRGERFAYAGSVSNPATDLRA